MKTAGAFLSALYVMILCITLPVRVKADEDSDVYNTGTGEPTVQFGPVKNYRYLLYNVNKHEGFNGRLDFHLGVAYLTEVLNLHEPWMLVLPPFAFIQHWKNLPKGKDTSWEKFMDLEFMNEYIPVMDFKTFWKQQGSRPIDEMYLLQPDLSGRNTFSKGACDQNYVREAGIREQGSYWTAPFWEYEGVRTKSFSCIYTSNSRDKLERFLLRQTKARTVMLERAEVTGGVRPQLTEYWNARRSLRFASHIIALGNEFRSSVLHSDDKKDITPLAESWSTMEKSHREAVGGPYISAHVRRQDYKEVYEDTLPSLRSLVKQISVAANENNVTTVFLSTDADDAEVKEVKKKLRSYGLKVHQYVPPREEVNELGDGGVALVQMWIAAHARYFLGTNPSTFSKRIMEERQILGFSLESSSRTFCTKASKEKCSHVWQYEIAYDDSKYF